MWLEITALLIPGHNDSDEEIALDHDGRCTSCGTELPGVFAREVGRWGRRRPPVHLGRPAQHRRQA